MGRASAPGKIILCGEHFVVHGSPAIALPLGQRRVTVTLETEPGPWQLDAPAHRQHLAKLLVHIGLDPDVVRLSVTSTVPLGAGLGSSAALAVALVRASGVTDPSRTRELAHRLEQVTHGQPSGIDDAVAAWERPIWFQREQGAQPFEAMVPGQLWVAVTTSRTSTRAAVRGVRERFTAAPAWAADLVRAASRLVEGARDALTTKAGPRLGQLLSDNHALLREIGVSTPALDELVGRAVAAGAWGAKLTGGGLGGAMIALAPPDLDLIPALSGPATEEVFAL